MNGLGTRFTNEIFIILAVCMAREAIMVTPECLFVTSQFNTVASP